MILSAKFRIKYSWFLNLAFFCLINLGYAQQTFIKLWPNGAPGSEHWTQKENTMIYPGTNISMQQNVTDPTLRYFPSTADKSTKTAVIIAPGGGFETIVEGLEGPPVAQQLNALGIKVFLLRYRIFKTNEDFVNKPGKVSGLPDWTIRKAMFEKDLKPMVIADAQQAVKYVREHAAEYEIDPSKIGFMGFSAGGTVASLVTFVHDSLSRPDFSAIVYGPLMTNEKVPEDAPPIFLLHAADDAVVPASNSIDLYNKWKSAGKEVELHIYSKGGHGFGGIKHNLPVDGWVTIFYDWLVSGKFLD